MATFEFDMPDGTKKRAIGNTPEEAWQSVNASLAPPSEPRKPGEKGPLKIGDPVEFLRGVSQGVMDPIEGLVQLAEKSTGWNIAPEGLRNWAREYRKQAQSTIAGQGGEVVGNIAGFMIPGMVAARMPALFSAAGLGGRAIMGAAGGLAQPVTGGDNTNFARTKANQAIEGLAGGTVFPAAAGWVAKAGNLPSHFSWSHPVSSLFGMTAAPTIGQVAQQAQRLTPGAAGRIAGEVQGQLPTEQQE